MSRNRKHLKFSLSALVLAASVAAPTAMGAAFAAEQLSADQIIKALKPAKLTRSLTLSPAEAARADHEKKFISGLRNRSTRSLTSDEREQVATIAASRPSVDLEITFEFNSAVIGAAAAPQVAALGQALTSSGLQGRTFVLAGHTDAKGTDSYNQGLSERRADAVKRYLMERYSVDVANLVTVGYGKGKLKDLANPLSFENRRVQIVNVDK
jgi:outer membrane protein OmpA-like peptidoglycan-associated protein